MADGAVVTTVLDTGAGQDGLVRRLVEVPAGSRYGGAAGPGGELWFVIAGTGRLSPGAGPAMPVRPGTALWLPPGAGYRFSADGPGALRLDAVSLPAGTAGRAATGEGRAGAPGDTAGPRRSELGGW